MTEERGTVAVVGAGSQGPQIAFRCALAGFQTNLHDRSPAALEAGRHRIEEYLERWAQGARITGTQAGEALARLRLCPTLGEAVSEVDIVIEAVPENLELKRTVWRDIDALAPAPALLTSNSSSIRSSRMASATRRPDRTFSVNFSLPSQDSLVEVMWNADTSDDTRQRALAFLHALDMHTMVTEREIQGFSFNRVWRAVKKECLHLWAEGYCQAADLDHHFKELFSTNLGPFQLMDIIGLDVVRDIELSYFEETGDSSDRPPAALDELIAAGHLGVKTGQGFYRYE